MKGRFKAAIESLPHRPCPLCEETRAVRYVGNDRRVEAAENKPFRPV
jgi:hypothetical protein